MQGRTILVVLIILELILLDAFLTLTAPMLIGTSAEPEQIAFRISFWSGLAYSAWVGTVFAIAAGSIIWLLEDMVRARWKKLQDRDTKSRDAILVANGVYGEFPARPLVYAGGEEMPDDVRERWLNSPYPGPSLIYTNDPTERQRYEASYNAALDELLGTRLSDRAMSCIPPVARRILHRVMHASPMIWESDSPLAADKLYTLLTTFLKVYRQTEGICDNLDYRLNYHVCRLLERGESNTAKVEAARCFYLGSILNFDVDRMYALLVPGDHQEQEALQKLYNRLRAVPSLEELVEPYIVGIRGIQTYLAAIHNEPRTMPFTHRGFQPTDPPWGYTMT